MFRRFRAWRRRRRERVDPVDAFLGTHIPPLNPVPPINPVPVVTATALVDRVRRTETYRRMERIMAADANPDISIPNVPPGAAEAHDAAYIGGVRDCSVIIKVADRYLDPVYAKCDALVLTGAASARCLRVVTEANQASRWVPCDLPGKLGSMTVMHGDTLVLVRTMHRPGMGEAWDDIAQTDDLDQLTDKTKAWLEACPDADMDEVLDLCGKSRVGGRSKTHTSEIRRNINLD